jgi:hypothetical protein
MSDEQRDLTVAAARAAGIAGHWDKTYRIFVRDEDRKSGPGYGSAVFVPLEENVDALCLAVAVLQHPSFAAAMRLAITEAAAGIGNLQEAHA